ncbi:hypothetical protein [Cellvibrio sp. QJXJ]|uniref:hypothetical protein n=1 Tax=Cellvibrio sp. QJXJ TaxID=2964606 RepID=UPI0021C35857|nr:hypothetical protein [Cellvibrio sp. QJXJ]UUA73112.1 hypothetical protein NNX04_01365 [Cellvibrio sp. QJXJ]
MDEQIKRINQRKHTELFSNIHLPILARVEAVSDPVNQEAISERYRPRYAVDVRVLKPNGAPDELLPLFRAVPLPVAMAGLERGAYGFPEAGTIVELAFAFGLPDRPFIRTILTEGLSLPSVARGEVLLQASADVYQRADSAGDWHRSTTGDIYDDAVNYVLECYSATTTANEFLLRVKQNSTEEVVGVKTIEALGALKLLSAGTANLSALDNLNITTGSDVNQKVGRDVKQRVGNNIDSMAVAKQLLRVKNGGKVWLGSESENVLQILSELIQVVANIANTAKDHTHEYTDNGAPLKTKKPDQSGDFGGQKGSADGLKERLDPIVE